MRAVRLSLVAIIFLFILSFAQPASPGGQTATAAPQSSPQALTLLHQSLAALTGGRPITDVTLSGTAHRIAGSDDDSGTATLKALAGTGARLDLSLSSGPRTELRNTSGPEPVGSWSGPDGIAHSMAYHNVLTDIGLSPLFTLTSILSNANSVLTYVGPETRDGHSVIHISALQQFPALPGDGAALMQHLTQTEIFLDLSTGLPVALAFKIHPDDNALLDIPVEIQFSDYRNVNGSQIPFHVQKFLNNSLFLDLQFQTAAVNTGLTAAQVGA